MRIDIPASLTDEGQRWGLDMNTGEYEHQKVVISFGNAEIIELDPIEPFGRWDDDYEIERITQETVAVWLREKLA